MDDSWRTQMGISLSPPPPLRHRRSCESSSITRRSSVDDDDDLAPENFADVFGGPPQSVLSRKFSGDQTRSLYEEIFRHPDSAASTTARAGGSGGGGRSLAAFRFPASGEGFYSDVFGRRKGDDEGRMSRERSRPNSKGKSNTNSTSTSSVLSFEELSPLRRNLAGADHDPAFSSFLSKLRPINVPSRWNSTTTMKPVEEELKKKKKKKQAAAPSFPYNRPSYADNDSFRELLHQNLKDNFVRVSASSPETIPTTLDPNSYWDDFDHHHHHLHLNSPPSSPVSMLCPDSSSLPKPTTTFFQSYNDEKEEEEEEEEEEEVMMSSYVIEINSDSNRDGNGVDDAIAWAKEKFHAHNEKQRHAADQAVEQVGSEDGCLEQESQGQTGIQHSMDDDDDGDGARRMTEEEKKAEPEKLWNQGASGEQLH